MSACVFSSSVPETNSQDIYYLENGGQPAQGIFIGCCITYPKNFFHKFHLIVFNYLSALKIQSINNLFWSKKHFSITTPVISAWLEGWKRITKIDFQHDKTAFYGKLYLWHFEKGDSVCGYCRAHAMWQNCLEIIAQSSILHILTILQYL